MKTIIYFTTLLMIISSAALSQSTMTYDAGSGVTVTTGADICADQVTMNGTFSGGGSICGASAPALNLIAIIEGFYRSDINKMIPDTVTIYLRDAVSPFAKVDSATVRLDSSGAGTYNFSNATSGLYYLSTKHRNSIETWSSSPVSFYPGGVDYNFSTAASQAYGSNMKQVDSAPLTYGIYSGDVDQDGSVDLTDLALIDNGVFNYLTGYVQPDINGDNFVDLSDLTIADNNAFNYVNKVTPIP